MERKRVAHVLQVDELRDFAVGIASDVHDHAVAIGRRGQPMDRHDREQLSKGPMIKKRLEHGKIADVLIAQRSLELFYFLRHVAQTAMHVDNLLGELPIDGLDFCFRFEIEQAEVEHLLRFFLDLLDVVQALDAIAAFQPLFHVENVGHELVILFDGFDFQFRRGSFDGTERFHHEHGMVRDDRATAFTHDRGMGHTFRIADVGDVPDDIVGVFLERIIRRAIEVAARAIIIDAQTATNIEIAELVTKFCELRVIAGGFAYGALDRRNVRNLRADVEMNEFEAMA